MQHFFIQCIFAHAPPRLTTLFLAAKTTNNAISLDAYTSHIPQTSPSDVLDLEFLVAQSLSFEFAVWHAHTALWGIWLDYQVSVGIRSRYLV
jgi:cyclin H